MVDKLVNHLGRERARAGLTQAALADRIGVSRKTINTIENGIFIPSTVLALKLARAFAIPVESLFELPGRNDESSGTGQEMPVRSTGE